ncbi:DUF6415 family natural product biosynthesis protein [Streptomyces chartreusis]|uniref:DUF6415 family natural product biosynthesis protein n=1 Tax=Streptomyces chartreusis TaxID=1969 RepID=UPI003867AA05
MAPTYPLKRWHQGFAGVGEARRRLGLPARSGLQAEYERVKRLAMSVIALCDHLDALTGINMCLLCDKELEAGQIRIRALTIPHPSAGSQAWAVNQLARVLAVRVGDLALHRMGGTSTTPAAGGTARSTATSR